MSKRRLAKKAEKGYVRVTLAIPRDLWSFFERQRKKPEHFGNRSSYVRSLILQQMNDT